MAYSSHQKADEGSALGAKAASVSICSTIKLATVQDPARIARDGPKCA